MSDTTERDELAKEIFLADNWRWSQDAALKDWDALSNSAQRGSTYAHHIADGLIAKGYRKAEAAA